MNVVQEIKRINAKELELNSTGSWHDQYKDSAYIYVGGLPNQLTEGDVITIFSQYGEVIDISLPRDAATQKTKGFAFLMYADQRSTILAVDNLGGSKILERTLRVDHVLNYKQLERDKESGKMVERDIQSLAAHPDKFKSSNKTEPGSPTYSTTSSHDSIDPEDPMRDFLIQERKAAKLLGGGSSGKDKEKKRSRKEGEESKEERRERRDKKKRAKELKEDSKRDRDASSFGKGKERESGGNNSNRRDDRTIESSRRDDRDDRRYNDSNSSSRRNYDEDDRRDSSRRRDDDRDESRRSDRGDRDDYNSSRSNGGGDRDRRDDRDDRRDRERDDGKDKNSSKNSFADLEKWARGS